MTGDGSAARKKKSAARSAEFRAIASARDWERPGLSRAARRTANAAIEALICERHGDRLVAPEASWRKRVSKTYDLSIGACSLQLRIGMRLLLFALEWLPLVITGVPSRMARLPLEWRVRYLTALEHHPRALFTMLLVATKIPMLMSAFERGPALALTGYDRETTAARRAKPRLPVAR